jgi:NADH-quinone oxidoreductase subunit J
VLDAIFFYSFAALALVGAILTVTRRNAVHSAIWLIVSLLGVAGLFLLQQAEFLFAVQIVVYVGGIMVLFLFVIMLVNLDRAAHLRQFNRQWWIALALAGLAGIGLMAFVKGPAASAPPLAPPEGNTLALANVMFREYLLPFELASALLLVAIVGAVVMARGAVVIKSKEKPAA